MSKQMSRVSPSRASKFSVPGCPEEPLEPGENALIWRVNVVNILIGECFGSFKEATIYRNINWSIIIAGSIRRHSSSLPATEKSHKEWLCEIIAHCNRSSFVHSSRLPVGRISIHGSRTSHKHIFYLKALWCATSLSRWIYPRSNQNYNNVFNFSNPGTFYPTPETSAPLRQTCIAEVISKWSGTFCQK